MSANDLWQAVVRPEAGLFVQLTWALGHFLWQGCAIAIGYAVLARLLRRASANVRYTAGVVALLMMAAALPATLWLQSPQETLLALADSTQAEAAAVPATPGAGEALPAGDEPADAAIVRYVPPPVAVADAAQETSRAERIRAVLSEASPYVGTVYLAGLVLMLLRVALGLWSGRRLRGQCEPISDWAVLDVLRRNARRMGLRVVPAIACCGRISVPIVVGVLRPMILLPASFASGLNPAQVEAVLAHELAHIRRFDLAVNVFQRLVEAVLFFHPGVWWVSRRVSLERENACDDAVLRLDHERVQYADALLRLAELCAGGAADGGALAATGNRSSHFRQRVLRLLAIDEKPPVRLTSFGVLASLLLATLLVVAPLMWRNAVSAGPNTGAAAESADQGGFVAGVKEPSPPSDKQPKPSAGTEHRSSAAKDSANVVRAGNEVGPAASSSPAAGPRLLTVCADDLDVRKVLEMLSRESKANIVVSPGASGKLTMNVRDKNLDEILAIVARVCNLVVRRDGDAIYVSTLAEDRKSQEGNLPVRLYRLKYAKSSDVLNVIATLKSPKGIATRLSDDEAVIVRDYEDVLKVIERVVAACDMQGGAVPPANELKKPAAAPPVAGRSPVSVHAESLDVRKVLELLSRETASNMIVSPHTSGQLTMDIRDKPFDEALAMIAKVCNLVIRHEGDTVIVSTLAEERKAEEDRLPVRLYRLKYVKSSDMLNVINTLKSPKGRATKLSGADSGRGEVIVVQDYEDVLKAMDRVIAQIDVQPVQVLIEAVLLEAKPGAALAAMKELHSWEFAKFVAEVGEDNARKTVVGLDAVMAPGMPPPRLAPAVPNTGMFGWIGQNHDKFLKLLEAKGETRVLAAPRLLVLNKQLAQIELGDLMTKHVSPNTVNGKWKLTFRPFVSSDGHVRLTIRWGDHDKIAADARGKTKNEDGAANGPRPFETDIIIPPDAPTIVIVPDAVSSKADNPPKKEVVMLITAKVVKPQGDDVPVAGLPSGLNLRESAPALRSAPAYRPTASPVAPTPLPTSVAPYQSDADKLQANMERMMEETRRRIVEKALAVLKSSPPAPQEKRIEAALKIIRVCDLSRDETKTWATALRELIVIGKPAVPKLIEELDRTQRNHSLRALGFVLRGIGDPRAVPALIRAIPRTLEFSSGSDCGEAIRDDLELARFMREHDNDHVGKPAGAPARDPAEFSFGRPINEIMPALAKITGQDFGWREFRFAYTDAGPDATRVQRKAFLDHAQRWANGWSKHWREHVANESEAQLELTRQALDQYAKTIPRSPKQPRTEFPHGRKVKAGNHSIDQFIKSFDEWPDSGFHDLDTGRLISPPKSLLELSPKNEPSEKLIVWAKVEGVDLINIKRKSPGSDKWHYAFLPVDMTVWRIADERFANVEMELRASKKFELPAPWKGPLEQVDEKTGLYDDSLSATYLFITKEGVCGVLRLDSPLSRELIPGQISSHKGGLHCKYIYESDEKPNETGGYSLPVPPPAAGPALPVMPKAGAFGVE